MARLAKKAGVVTCAGVVVNDRGSRKVGDRKQHEQQDGDRASSHGAVYHYMKAVRRGIHL